jgi:hypothetical protein
MQISWHSVWHKTSFDKPASLGEIYAMQNQHTLVHEVDAKILLLQLTIYSKAASIYPRHLAPLLSCVPVYPFRDTEILHTKQHYLIFSKGMPLAISLFLSPVSKGLPIAIGRKTPSEGYPENKN